MSAQGWWHLVRIFEERGKDCAVRLNQWVVGVEDVEINIAVVSVNRDFDAVANVVRGLVADLMMC